MSSHYQEKDCGVKCCLSKQARAARQGSVSLLGAGSGCTHAPGKQSITSKAHLTPPAIFLPNGNNLQDPKYCLTAWIKEDKEIFAILLQNWSLHYNEDKRVFVCPHYMKLFQQNN